MISHADPKVFEALYKKYESYCQAMKLAKKFLEEDKMTEAQELIKNAAIAC